MSEGEVRELIKGPKFPIKILSCGEKGVELGAYRDEIVKLSYEMSPGYYDYDNIAEAAEEVDTCAKKNWEAIVLAFDGERMIGFGSITHLEEGNMELDSAFVSPEYRRRGVYNKLLQERIELARRKGANSVTIQAMGSSVARSSYTTHHGFIKIHDPNAVGGIIYKKTLINL